MKRIILTLIGASTLASLPLGVMAGDAMAQPTDTATKNQKAMAAGSSAKASDLIGTEVRNYQDEKLGKVAELAVDIESGRILQVILSSGGFAGIGDTLYLVPTSSLRYDPAQKLIHLDATAAQVKASPAFEMSRWNDSFDSAQLSRSADYYGADQKTSDRPAEWLTKSEGDLAETAMRASRTGQVQKASTVMGLEVRNLQADTLGEVKDLLVNLNSGRIVAVVISSGEVLGIRDELTAIPPSALRFTPTQDKLQLDITKQALADAPHFPATQWPDFDQARFTDQLSKYFDSETYSRPVAPEQPEQPDNTGRNVRDRDDQSFTPLDQGNGTVDVDISARIRKEIMASDRLSMTAKNVKVITRDSHVTLRGPTNTAEEKRLIGEIAGRIAGTGMVDNQLEVKTSSAAIQ